MASNWQVLFMGRTRDRAVDVGELTAIILVPGPDLRRHIGGLFGHDCTPVPGKARALPHIDRGAELDRSRWRQADLSCANVKLVFL